MNLEKLRYPIGRFKPPITWDKNDLKKWMTTIRNFPQKLKTTLGELDPNHIDLPYRQGGWTVRQVVHHLADSHMNSYIRFKWTLTEDTPVIKPYQQNDWADLPDAEKADVELSLQILTGVHARWIYMLDRFKEEDFKRELKHPEYKANLSLGLMLALYAWHCDHHRAHIQGVIDHDGTPS